MSVETNPPPRPERLKRSRGTNRYERRTSRGLVGITLHPPGQGANGRHHRGQAGRFMDHESGH
jgi:hypothetical protein